MLDVLVALVNASERAANVARACCHGSPEEGSLLIAEKTEGEANARFHHDFKTIADVLAQESAKTEIGIRCPNLLAEVRGEECSEIGGIKVALQENVQKTAECLSDIISLTAAMRMAEAAHSEPKRSLSLDLPNNLPQINCEELGVWIDPIDATSEFISGVRGDADSGRGLPCVTVLVGAYLKASGEPVIGVINQPFVNDGEGRIVWGVSHGETRRWGGSDIDVKDTQRTVLLSGAEKPNIVKQFEDSGWEVKSVPGAGHKLLKVALGEASAYIVSQGTTFRWDTCAPHAILKAKGGDIISYTTRKPIKYNDPHGIDTQQYCNASGIIAYNDENLLVELDQILN